MGDKCMKMNIVFWLSGPPICCKGIFDKVALNCDGEAYYICSKKIDKNRSKIFNDELNSMGNVKYIFLEQEDNPKKYGEDFILEHLDDIHIFNGYLSNYYFLKFLLKHNKSAKTIVWLERIGHRGINKGGLKNKVINKLQEYKHHYYALKLRNKISALMPIGQRSIETYRKLGWKGTNMFPFFYMPVMNETLPQSHELTDGIVKFVYLGRFSAGGKGTDNLINACKKLKNTNYTLEMVGGYGDYKEHTINYINSNEHLHFGGTWKINDACDNLNKYDVCIVPSRYEGWNPTINEALMAGIGCITTNESVSDELVSSFDCGIVTESNPDSIARTMDFVMKNVGLVNTWKKNAFNSRKNMNSDICADYFIDVLNYLFFGKSERPELPWKKEIR